MDILSLPPVLLTPIIAAIIASAAYVAKLLIQAIVGIVERSRSRRARLVELKSLLDAARVSFLIQTQHIDHLLTTLAARDASLVQPGHASAEQIFLSAYPSFTSEEKALHEIIRSITVHALHPTNMALLRWVEQNTFFVGWSGRSKRRRDFAIALGRLNAHLMLWRAKYQTRIPDRQDTAIVYMADEEKHGLPFPHEIDRIVYRILDLPKDPTLHTSAPSIETRRRSKAGGSSGSPLPNDRLGS